MRSRAAAAVLANAGFPLVASMAGGINAWHGLVAKGPPEAGMAHFPPGTGTEALAALAFRLEAGSRAFYGGIAREAAMEGMAGLLAELGHAEEQHMESLRELYRELAGGAGDIRRAASQPEPLDAYMEGGVEVRAALEWSRGRTAGELLEYCVSLEVNSLDLYLKMLRTSPGDGPRRVFSHLVREEQRHLELLTAQMELLSPPDIARAPGLPPA